MRKLGPVKKFLVLLAFVFFPVAGYLTVGTVTQCHAAACFCDEVCVAPNSLASAITSVYNNIIRPALLGANAARDQLIAYFTPLSEQFLAGILPIIDWTTREVLSWFDTFWYYNLQPAMQTMTDQLITANAEQSLAMGSFIDAANIIRAKKTLEDMSLKDHRELRPGENVCVAGTTMGGMTRATAFSKAYNAAAPAERLPRTANAAAGFDSAGNPLPNNPSANGISTDLQDRWKAYINRYCRIEYNNGNSGCSVGGILGTGFLGGAPAFPDQDIDVAGTIFMKDTIDLTNVDTRTNLNDLITNIAEPIVKDPVAAGTDKNAPGILLDVQSYKTKRQIIYDDLYHIVARRAPGGQQGNFVQLLAAMRQETGEDLSTSPNPSRNEVLRAMMTQRFRSGKYSLRQIDEPENNRREMVIEQALQLMQMNDQLDLMDRYSLLLASQVSAEIKGSKPLTSAARGMPQ
jgi:hypothetical protein